VKTLALDMPLFNNAAPLIRANLEEIIALGRPCRVEIGELSPEQLSKINQFRVRNELPPIIARIVFIGRHVCNSRIRKDGYSIDEVVEQIESALQSCCEVKLTELRTALQNPNKRADNYGNAVTDRAILECTRLHPWPELLSVIPVGDKNRPTKSKDHP
jgi:hypothetical protein